MVRRGHGIIERNVNGLLSFSVGIMKSKTKWYSQATHDISSMTLADSSGWRGWTRNSENFHRKTGAHDEIERPIACHLVRLNIWSWLTNSRWAPIPGIASLPTMLGHCWPQMKCFFKECGTGKGRSIHYFLVLWHYIDLRRKSRHRHFHEIRCSCHRCIQYPLWGWQPEYEGSKARSSRGCDR